MKNSYTVFGKGFVGVNLVNFLKKKNYKFFLPKRNQYIINKNLNNIIYCIGSDNWVNNPKGSFDSNLGIVKKIIFNNKFESFTLISSTRLYLSNTKSKCNEESLIEIRPTIRNFYYNSLKLMAESLCLSLPNKKIKVVRMSNLFGDNFTNQIYLLPNLIRSSLVNKKINITINKKSSKDFINVDEALDLLLKIIRKSKYRLYNIASGKNIKLSTIAENIKKITNCKINYVNQRQLVKEPIIDIGRIRKEFKFEPRKDLIKSLNQLIINYRRNLK